MKKLTSIILLFLVSTALTSCNDTDIVELQPTNTINYNESNKEHNELYIIEKDEVGGEYPDDNQQKGLQY